MEKEIQEDWEKWFFRNWEYAKASGGFRVLGYVEPNLVLDFIRSIIASETANERERIAYDVESMKSIRWGEHGMDCLAKLRPCGNEGVRKPLADTCTICRYDEQTLRHAASRIRSNP